MGNHKQHSVTNRLLDSVYQLMLDDDYSCADCSNVGTYVVRWRSCDGIGRRRLLCQAHALDQVKKCYARDCDPEYDPEVAVKENSELALLVHISTERALRDARVPRRKTQAKARRLPKRVRV